MTGTDERCATTPHKGSAGLPLRRLQERARGRDSGSMEGRAQSSALLHCVSPSNAVQRYTAKKKIRETGGKKQIPCYTAACEGIFLRVICPWQERLRRCEIIHDAG